MAKETARLGLRPIISGAATAGLAATILTLPMAAQAQLAGEVQEPAKKDGSVLLNTVTIESQGNSGSNTNSAVSSSSRIPGTVKDIPQVVNTIPEKLIIEQNATTLEQALRNVPGITVAIGEANGGPNGDRFRIRGFEAIGDSYRDGLRDFGVYVRDSFNLEQVQVLKGPSGESFGVGTTGGAINTTSKSARLGTFGSADVSFGNGPLIRSTLDYNKQINDTTAVRLNVMGNRQDIVDRDDVKSDRWGVAGSVGFGNGTDTSWYLDYMHQSNNRTPDYGVPMAAKTPTGTGVRKPITELGVPRSNFYGKDTDKDRSDVDMLTSRFSKDVNDWLTIKNDTRLVRYSRYFSTTTTNCGANDTACNAVGKHDALCRHALLLAVLRCCSQPASGHAGRHRLRRLLPQPLQSHAAHARSQPVRRPAGRVLRQIQHHQCRHPDDLCADRPRRHALRPACMSSTSFRCGAIRRSISESIMRGWCAGSCTW